MLVCKSDFRVNIQTKVFLKFSYFPLFRIFDHASNTLFLSVSQDIFLVCQTSFLILHICKSNINIFILKISFCKSNINLYVMVNMVATLLTHQILNARLYPAGVCYGSSFITSL